MKKVILILVCIAVGVGVGFYGCTILNNRKSIPEVTLQTEEPAKQEEEVTKQIEALRGKKGSDFDKDYINLLMLLSQNKIAVADLADGRTEREEIKKWSDYILRTEPKDISTVKTWYGQWGFRAEDLKNDPHEH